MQGPRVRFDNSYARLPGQFYTAMDPDPVAAPAVVRVNRELAEQLGFDPRWLASPQGAQALAGNARLDGSRPIATAYAGHQFGGFSPRLGDGRAILLGEVLDRDGQRFDIQLKGSGRTPYSRGGDGRSPLGPVLREYIVSEAMMALGIPTTRSLAAVTTGEKVFRDSVLPGGVLTRVARSHIRVGTFEFFAAQGDGDSVSTLVNHVLERHFPDRVGADVPALALLEGVVERQADLIARWQSVGFIHGVMNTDNMLVSGETIDYGPCAFMNEYDPATVYSSIDSGGRYAYGNQPGIAHWNLLCLARALLVATGTDDTTVDQVQEILDRFPRRFAETYGGLLADKLGLPQPHTEADQELVEVFLELLGRTSTDFTLAFRKVADLAGPDGVEAGGGELGGSFDLPDAFAPWLRRWRRRLEQTDLDPAERRAAMWRLSPVFIPRNHRVEAALAAATDDGDFAPFHRLVDVLANPFELRQADAAYLQPPRPHERVRATFCGT